MYASHAAITFENVYKYYFNCSDLALNMSQNQMACFRTLSFSHHKYETDERAKSQNTKNATPFLLPNELAAPELNSQCKLQISLPPFKLHD